MKIILAKTAGFCMGVKRAVDLALEHTSRSNGGVATIGPLIHNKQTLDMLVQRGVKELDPSEEYSSGSKMLIRAHGIPPDQQTEFSQKGHEIIDGTCPKVKTVHKVIERHRKQGFTIVITGDEGHAEVIGLLGYAGKSGILINSVDDVAGLPECLKVCLVSQTTFDRQLFDEIATAMRNKYQDVATLVIKKTICSATDLRQTEVASLAQQVDAIVVVGGKNSANTQRLAKIAGATGVAVQLVETEKDLVWDKIAEAKTVGVTAGASTPNWMIKRVTDYILFMAQRNRPSIGNLFRRLLDYGSNINVFAALGAVAVYFTSGFLQNIPCTLPGASIAFLYFLSMYLWNSMASIETMQHHGISRYRFYHEFRRSLLMVSVVCILVLLAVSFFIRKEVGFLMLFATVVGLVYHTTYLPKSIRALLRYKNLKDIPSSRDLFVALAWATVLTALPPLVNGVSFEMPVAPATFCWVFILAFLRSLIFDLRDIEGDRIMGRETLITIVGEKRARKYLQVLIVSSFFALMLFPACMGFRAYLKQNTVRFLYQIPVLLYIYAFVRVNPRIDQGRTLLFNLFADGLFFCAGFGALLASVFLSR